MITIEDWGPNQIDNGGDDTRQQIFVTASQVQANSWVTIEAPLTLVNRNNIGLIIMENILEEMKTLVKSSKLNIKETIRIDDVNSLLTSSENNKPIPINYYRKNLIEIKIIIS